MPEEDGDKTESDRCTESIIQIRPVEKEKMNSVQLVRDNVL
jgi:hypothetical protein